jgi:hypothetical protein
VPKVLAQVVGLVIKAGVGEVLRKAQFKSQNSERPMQR